MSAKQKFRIVDWAGNIMFKDKKFNSFDDGEEFLCLHFEKNNMDYDEWRGEFYVDEVNEK